MTSFTKYIILLIVLDVIEIFCIIYPITFNENYRVDDAPGFIYTSWIILGILIPISIILFLYALYYFRKSLFHLFIIFILNLHLIAYGIYFFLTGHF